MSTLFAIRDKYINQEYRNKAKLIGNNGYKVPKLGNINTNGNISINGYDKAKPNAYINTKMYIPNITNINGNIKLKGYKPYYSNPVVTNMLNRSNDFISYMNGYRY